MTVTDILSSWFGSETDTEPEIETETADIYLGEALSVIVNRRRRLAIDHLARDYGPDEPTTPREVSEYIAAIETDCEPDTAPRDEYHTVYVSMSQSHLDELEESNVIERPGEHTIVAGPALETVHGILTTAEAATRGGI